MSTLPALAVEVDLFSGRPNPGWVLSPPEAAELLARLRALAPGGEPPPAPGLGYRGFLVHRAGPAGARPWLRVRAGAVQAVDGSRPALFRDTAGVEAWLREQAERRGMGPFPGTSTPG
jgi:hypothetical protein